MSNRNGSNWIRKDKRFRIYARDWFKCQYPGCLATKHLTLDHMTARHNGGTNSAWNLVTACLTHNSSRGHKRLATVVGKEHARHMRRQARKPLPSLTEARERQKYMRRLWG